MGVFDVFSLFFELEDDDSVSEITAKDIKIDPDIEIIDSDIEIIDSDTKKVEEYINGKIDDIPWIE